MKERKRSGEEIRKKKGNKIDRKKERKERKKKKTTHSSVKISRERSPNDISKEDRNG